ncbi:MAG: ABC transporter permease [Gemmatimonadales bacterium]
MTAAYRWLLRLYPASFRREYGAEMTALFAARRQATGGILGTARLWVDTVFDTIGNAALIHADLLRQDTHYALRSLRRVPGFTATVILIIALGIGANTAAFSVADFVFFRPIPFRGADRLVTIWERVPEYDAQQPSPANYRDWQVMSRAFDSMGAYHQQSSSLLGGSSPQQIGGIAVDGPVLDMLGIAPLLGRLPSADETRRNVPVVVLSYALWQGSFGADPAELGRQVTLDGSPFTVIGVMPRRFAFPDRTAQFWVPMQASEVHDDDRSNSWFYVVARLKPGWTVPQAQRDMDRVAAVLARSYPKDDGAIGANVLSLRDTYNQVFSTQSAALARTLLFSLCGAAFCILLITCANLANLLLVRGLARRRELSVRTALGAGRERLVRQLLTESLLLAAAGGAIGIVLAYLAMPLLSALIPMSLPWAEPPTIDLRVLLAAAVLSIATGLGFGVLPAIRTGRGSSFDGLRDDTRSGGGRRARFRSALVVAEVTASVVLLVATALLLRAILRVRAIDPGFRADHVMTLRTELPPYRYSLVATRTAFFDGVLGRVRALPGVRAAGYITALPMRLGGGIWPVSIPPDTGDRHASLRFITPGYISALQIRTVRGRDVTDGDTPMAPWVAVVSQSFAARYWPGRDPIGQHFKFAFADRTIVGVVEDVRVRGPERVSEPQVYLPYQQVPDSALVGYVPKDLVVRSTLPREALVRELRRIIHDADPLQAISNVETLDAVVAEQSASRTVQVRTLAGLAALAVLLAGIGLHGVLAFSVSQRRQEIAIRMALGARQEQVIGMVVRQGAILALAGIIPGLVLAGAAGRAMASALAGVSPFDLTAFSIAAVLAAVMVIAGSWWPSVQASRVEPTSALHGQ